MHALRTILRLAEGGETYVIILQLCLILLAVTVVYFFVKWICFQPGKQDLIRGFTVNIFKCITSAAIAITTNDQFLTELREYGSGMPQETEKERYAYEEYMKIVDYKEKFGIYEPIVKYTCNLIICFWFL